MEIKLSSQVDSKKIENFANLFNKVISVFSRESVFLPNKHTSQGRPQEANNLNKSLNLIFLKFW